MVNSTHGGWSRYHTWGLLVPLAASISPMFLSGLVAVPGWPEPLNALVAGTVVAVVAYVLMHLGPLKETYALAKAVLCGLLVAEVMVLHASDRPPTMAGITLWLFFYFHSVEGK